MRDLAAHGKAPSQCRLAPDRPHAALFGPAPAVFGHVAKSGGEIVGFMLWFLNFSTWRGRHGVYL